MTKKQYENTSIRGGETEGDCLLPVVVFSFSKAKCEEIADFLMGQDLLTGKEKGEVSSVCVGVCVFMCVCVCVIIWVCVVSGRGVCVWGCVCVILRVLSV
jgi:hypothetical protein